MGIVRQVVGWLDGRLGFSRKILPIMEHPVPRSINWWYVLGSATLTAFIVQVVTGVALAFTYVPAPNSAYDTLEFITHEALLGNIVRGIHFWGSSAMVILIFLHLCRTLLMAAYKFPRELNWITGVLLFGLTLGMAFSGQLLRWNQDAYWAVVVVAEQAARAPIIGDWLAKVVVAGQTVGAATLTRFYATHVFLFPAAMFGLIGVHLYLVVHHGISEPPGRSRVVDPATYEEEYEEILRKESIPFWPDAAWRDVVFALAVGCVVVLLAVLVGPADLGNRADPTNVRADPKPDWYFLWLFALLAILPTSIEDWFIVGFPLLMMVGLLALPLVAPKGERSPFRRPWVVASVGISMVAIATLVAIGSSSPWSPNFDPGPLPATVTQRLSGDALRGSQLFESKDCIACHMIAGVGGRRGPELTEVAKRLTPAQATTRIASGGNNMPAYGGTLAADELAALVAFLGEMRGQS